VNGASRNSHVEEQQRRLVLDCEMVTQGEKSIRAQIRGREVAVGIHGCGDCVGERAGSGRMEGRLEAEGTFMYVGFPPNLKLV
jgi:hypothetical protein